MSAETTSNDTLDVMAGLAPDIPILCGATLDAIEITGTRPVMTEEANIRPDLKSLETRTRNPCHRVNGLNP